MATGGNLLTRRRTGTSGLRRGPRHRMGKVFQYRLLWKYRTQRTHHELVSEKPLTILKMLRRLCSDEPWTGATRRNLRIGWTYYARRKGLLWDEVVDMSVRDVQRAIQEVFGPLEWLRVEFRQVGPWTEMLDPLTNLRGKDADRWDMRAAKNLAEVESMSPAALLEFRVRTPQFIEGLIRAKRQREADAPALGRARDGQQGTPAGAGATGPAGTHRHAR